MSETSSDLESNDNVPREGRLAGVDYGTVRIGVAICNAEQTLASPLENYNRRNQKKDAEFFQQLVEEERLVGFVVGLPVHLSGDESQKSIEAREFGKWLQELTGLPVTYYDERFTSVIAEEYLMSAELTKKKRKARLDKLAAQILLTSYLESNRDQSTKKPQALDDA